MTRKRKDDRRPQKRTTFFVNQPHGDMEWVKAKLADMEDRSRCNNLKISGVPESIQQADLRFYATFKIILPEATDMELTMDRIKTLTLSIPRA